MNTRIYSFTKTTIFVFEYLIFRQNYLNIRIYLNICSSLTQGWSLTRRMSTTDSDFITLTELTKLILISDNCHGWSWSPTIPRMVDHQPNDGHPPEQQEPHLDFLGQGVGLRDKE